MDTPERVLLIEDSIPSATAVKIILRRLGHKVDHAETGAEGFFLAASRDYEIILMDLGLPDMSGFEVTQKIRELTDPNRSAVPIIALTSYIDMQAKCLGSGMQGLIPKPLLQDQIDKVLKCNIRRASEDRFKEDNDRLIHAVLVDLKSKRNELLAHHEARDSSALRRVLHHLKGGACYLTKASLLNESLNELHDAVKHDFQNKERINAMVSRLLHEIDLFCHEHDADDGEINLH